MWSIRPLPEFTTWLNELPDAGVRGVLVARLKRLELGLAGDVRSVGGGVSELRIHVGAGWGLQALAGARHPARQGAGDIAGVNGGST